MYTSIVYLEACTVFVVLHFRMYVIKLMCIKVEMALKYNAARERLNRILGSLHALATETAYNLKIRDGSQIAT